MYHRYQPEPFYVELIRINDLDRKCFFGKGSILGGCTNGDVSRCTVDLAIDRPGDRNDTRVRIDREAPPIVVNQRISNTAGRRIRIGSESRHTDNRSNRSVFDNIISRPLLSITGTVSNSSTIPNRIVLVLVLVLESVDIARIVIS